LWVMVLAGSLKVISTVSFRIRLMLRVQLANPEPHLRSLRHQHNEDLHQQHPQPAEPSIWIQRLPTHRHGNTCAGPPQHLAAGDGLESLHVSWRSRSLGIAGSCDRRRRGTERAERLALARRNPDEPRTRWTILRHGPKRLRTGLLPGLGGDCLPIATGSSRA
jgi:hypothetical protein